MHRINYIPVAYSNSIPREHECGNCGLWQGSIVNESPSPICTKCGKRDNIIDMSQYDYGYVRKIGRVWWYGQIKTSAIRWGKKVFWNTTRFVKIAPIRGIVLEYVVATDNRVTVSRNNHTAYIRYHGWKI